LAPGPWGWTRAESPLDLPAGRQTLKIKASEPGARLDRIWLTSAADAAAPDGLGAAPPDTPCGVGQVPEPEADEGAGGAGGTGMVVGGDPEQQGAAGSGIGAGGSTGDGSASPASDGGNGAAEADLTGAPESASSDSGCSCRVVPSSRSGWETWVIFGLASALSAARRLRRAAARGS
jgi:hypothetical protein